MPRLLPRGHTAKGIIRHSAGRYHPTNLLFHMDRFGTIGEFQVLWKPGTIVPDIDWSKYFPNDKLDAWKVILNWQVQKQMFPTKAQDDAVDQAADLFGDGEIELPFRVPTLLEQE